MWLSIAFILLGIVAGAAFLGLCVAEATWRGGGTPAILLWVGAVYGLALVFIGLSLIALCRF